MPLVRVPSHKVVFSAKEDILIEMRHGLRLSAYQVVQPVRSVGVDKAVADPLVSLNTEFT